MAEHVVPTRHMLCRPTEMKQFPGIHCRSKHDWQSSAGSIVQKQTAPQKRSHLDKLESWLFEGDNRTVDDEPRLLGS